MIGPCHRCGWTSSAAEGYECSRCAQEADPVGWWIAALLPFLAPVALTYWLVTT